MSAYDATCPECGRPYTYYDAAPRLWCSVGCETAAMLDIGAEVVTHLDGAGGRPARTLRGRIKINRTDPT